MTATEYAEKRFSVYAACYCYGANYHTGQGDRRYRLLSLVARKGFKPGRYYGIDEDVTRADDPIADDLMARLIARGY